MPSTFRKMGSFIEDMDMFGHTITFNFDRKGNEHKTLIGGFVSVILKLAMFIYVVILFSRLIGGTRDAVSTTQSLVNDVEHFNTTYG